MKKYFLTFLLFVICIDANAMPFRVATYRHGYTADCSDPKSFTSFVELDKGIYLVSFNLTKNETTSIFFDEYQDLGNDWHLLRNNKVGMAYALTGSGLTLGKVVLENVTVFDLATIPKNEQSKHKSSYCMPWTKGSRVWDRTWDNFTKTHPLGQKIVATEAASKEKTCNTYNNAKASCATAGDIDRCIDIKMGWDKDKPLIGLHSSYVKNLCR